MEELAHGYRYCPTTHIAFLADATGRILEFSATQHMPPPRPDLRPREGWR